MATDWVKAISEIDENQLDELEARVDELAKELEALRTLRHVFRVRLGVKPPAKAVAKPPAKAETPKPARPADAPPRGAFAVYREAAAKYLIHLGTESKPATIAAACNVPHGSTTAVFDHPWFSRTPNGVALTPEGRRAAAGD